MVQWEASQCWSKRSTWSVPWWNFRRTSAEASMWTIQQATPCSRLNQTRLNVGGALQKDCACSSYGHTAQQTFRTTKPAQGKPSLNWGPNQAKQDRPAAKKNAKQLQEVQKLPCCHGSIRAPVTSRKRQRPLCEELASPFCQRSPLTLPDAGNWELLNYIWSYKVLNCCPVAFLASFPKVKSYVDWNEPGIFLNSVWDLIWHSILHIFDVNSDIYSDDWRPGLNWLRSCKTNCP